MPGAGKRVVIDTSDRGAVQHVTAGALAQAYVGTSTRWWETTLPDMEADGVIARVRGKRFARLSDIDAWLMGKR